MMEFAGSAIMPIIRIIEAQQKRPECGWAIYCKSSGSCWADTLLGAEDKCIPEKIVQQTLKEHAEGKKDETGWIITATIVLLSVMGLVFLCLGGKHMWSLFCRGSNSKDADSKTANGEEDRQSDLPGSEAASDYGDQQQE